MAQQEVMQQLSNKRIQQLAMRARVRPSADGKRALPARAASATTGKLIARTARATSGKCWRGMRKYGQITLLAMPTRSEGNGGKTAPLMMVTHDKGNNGQIASVRGNGDVGQVDGLCRECKDVQIVALAMATRSEGNNGQVAGARDGHARQRQQRANHRRTQQQ